MGYRIEADGGAFVLATDNEPGSPVHDKALRDLARDADVMVYDAQYTPEQLAGEKKGWGHSSWLEGVRIAQECNVKKLVLFHHDPDSDDAHVDGLVMRARQEFPNTWGANEGLTISLPDGVITHAMQIGGSERRVDRRYHVELPLRVTWRDLEGKSCETEGVAKDISRTGIFFVVPTVIRADEPVQLELVLPDEITHRGEQRIRFVARPVRQEKVGDSLRENAPGVAVAAALEITAEEPPLPPDSRPRYEFAENPGSPAARGRTLGRQEFPLTRRVGDGLWGARKESGEFVVSGKKVFRLDARFPHHRHEVRIPGPTRQQVKVQVIRHARPGTSS